MGVRASAPVRRADHRRVSLKILSLTNRAPARSMLHRLATLAIAFVSAAPVLAQDAPTPAPAAVSTKGPITIDAQTIEGVSDLEVTARGAAEIKRDDLSVYGEVLRYNRQFGIVEGEGGVRLQAGPGPFPGPRPRDKTPGGTRFLQEPKFPVQRELPARGKARGPAFPRKGNYP